VSSVGSNNPGQLTLYYKSAAETNWTTAKTEAVAYSASGVITLTGISTENAYEFKAVLSDHFTESAVDAQVQTAIVTMDFNASGRGVALGKVSEFDAFECAMPAIFTGTFRVGGGLNPGHFAGVTALTGSDGAGRYIRLFTFPINAYSGWNYSSMTLAFAECIFGAFSGTLDVHIRNSMANGQIAQQVFACRDCRGNPSQYSFYLLVENGVAAVYWHCKTNYQGISMRLINAHMPHAGFAGIEWDGVTKSTTAPDGVLCDYHGMGGVLTAHRNNVNQNLTAAETYEVVKYTSATTAGYGLTLSNDGGVVIGDGVKAVRISGQITAGAQANGLKYAAIWQNDAAAHLARTQTNVTTAAPQTIVFAPKLVNVAKGDVLTMRLYGAQGDVVYGGTMQSYFTVETVN
jgi:hypothetical protein